MRLCWSCEHFSFSGGQPHYSEVTPGYDSEFSCSEGVFEEIRIGDIDTPEDLRKLLETADKCEKFTPRLSQDERERLWKARREAEELEDAKKVSVINWSSKSAQELQTPGKVLKVGRKTWNQITCHLQGRHEPEYVKAKVLEILGYYPEAGEYRVEIVDDESGT